MVARRILIIDDEEGLRTSLSLILEDEGFHAVTAANAVEGLRAATADSFDVVLCDVRMPGRDGLALLPDLIAAQPEATVVMMSAHGHTETALEAVRRGAYDFIAKPFEPNELLLLIDKAAEREGLRRENRRLRRELNAAPGRTPLVAASAAMREIYELIERAAEFKTTVLVTGESGTGKEVAARTVHELSDRAPAPFIAVNCGAIPESLIESELFGHAKGAFTGADREAYGMFREADGGTLFLDEVGELPASVQVKLLRVLQEGEVRPVGEAKSIAVDVRIIAATARDIEAMVAARAFRDDLFYRLNVFRVHLPPLRERCEDIPVLADHFVERLAARLGCAAAPVSAEVAEALTAHDWPGNIRELENTLERALILSRGRTITPEALPFHTRHGAPATALPGPPPASTDEDLSIKRRSRSLENRLIRLALAETAGNRTHAARLLEISPRALQYKLKEYAIDPLNPLPSDSDSPAA